MYAEKPGIGVELPPSVDITSKSHFSLNFFGISRASYGRSSG